MRSLPRLGQCFKKIWYVAASCLFFILLRQNTEWSLDYTNIIHIARPKVITRNSDGHDKSQHRVNVLSEESRESNPEYGNSSTVGDYSGYLEWMQSLLRGELTLPGSVVSSHPNTINLGIIVINLNKNGSFNPTFQRDTVHMMDLVLTHVSSHNPIHYVIVTDENSSRAVGRMFVNLVSQRLSLDVIARRCLWRRSYRLPPLRFTLVDINQIIQHKPSFVREFQELSSDVSEAVKYKAALFYIGPIYHLAFTSLDKLIFLDSSDVEIRCDVSKLQEQFRHFDQELMEGYVLSIEEAPIEMERNEKAVMALGRDLALHYRAFLDSYIVSTKFKTLVGLAEGLYQGLNSGVVLYDLARMRASKLYNRYLEPGQLTSLFARYMYKPVLGDQDFFTLLGFNHPILIHLLDCHFNSQTSVQYMSGVYLDQFDNYHYCDTPNNLYVVHHNGCGPTPESCGNLPNETSVKYRKNAYVLNHLIVDWSFFDKMATGNYSLYE